MLDWKVGDKLVAIKTAMVPDPTPDPLNVPDLVVGREYTISEIGVTPEPCPDEACFSPIVLNVVEHITNNVGYCSCVFRKPIDFKKLCNVNKSVKEPDYA